MEPSAITILQMQTPELVRLSLNYGFAMVMAFLLWRFITDTQQKQIKTLENVNSTLQRVDRKLDNNEE